jgi:flavorubredoxin
MREFIAHLVERNYQNRTIGFIENGSWAPVATKIMKDKLSGLKNIKFLENGVKILSAVKEENIAQIDAMAKELTKE